MPTINDQRRFWLHILWQRILGNCMSDDEIRSLQFNIKIIFIVMFQIIQNWISQFHIRDSELF